MRIRVKRFMADLGGREGVRPLASTSLPVRESCARGLTPVGSHFVVGTGLKLLT